MNEDELDQLLKSAGWEEEAPNDFRRGVWSLIQAGESRRDVRVIAWLERVLEGFARPSVAIVGCLVMIAVGAMIGTQSAAHGADGKSTYAQVVSPFAARHP
ncbi:MAG: hypothetical protein ACQCXQ_10980 [Verrucomicrobiales bacterium]